MLYVIFARINNIKIFSSDKIAGIVEVLARIGDELVSENSSIVTLSSVYGRIWLIPDSVRVAIRSAEHVLRQAASQGIRLGIGITVGEIEVTQDLFKENRVGVAINQAARLAFLPRNVASIAVDEQVARYAIDAGPFTNSVFGRLLAGKVKQTKLKYRWITGLSVSITANPPSSIVSDTLAHVVVYDIVKFSEMTQKDQIRSVEDLRHDIGRALQFIGFADWDNVEGLWYAPAGDGGVIVFGSERKRAAWSFSRALLDHTEGRVPIRLGISSGIVVVVGGNLPVGTGVFGADQLSGSAEVGKPCVNHDFWNSLLTEEKNDWHADSLPKVPNGLKLQRQIDRIVRGDGMTAAPLNSKVEPPDKQLITQNARASSLIIRKNSIVESINHVTYERALKCQQAIGPDLMINDPRVRSVGVGRCKEGFGVFVWIDSQTVVEGFRYPPQISQSDGVPIYYFATQWDASSFVRVPYFSQSDVHRIPEQMRHRHLCCGLQIQNYDLDLRNGILESGEFSCGTLGCFVVNKNDDVFLLTSNHIVGASEGKFQDRICQPGTLHLDSSHGEDIASLYKYAPVVSAGTDNRRPREIEYNTIDASIAKIDDNICDHLTNSFLASRNVPRLHGWADAEIGEEVFKIGRSTGYTRGIVKAVNVVAGPFAYPQGSCFFSEVLLIEGDDGQPFAAPGDSGSVIVNMRGNVVGLLFGGNGKQAYASYIKKIMRFFDCELLK